MEYSHHLSCPFPTTVLIFLYHGLVLPVLNLDVNGITQNAPLYKVSFTQLFVFFSMSSSFLFVDIALC